MVHLRTVHNGFHARVIAARLGADGIVTELRGSVDGPYPVGDVSVWVAEDDAECASELLLADEIEAAFDQADETGPYDGRRRRPLLFGRTATHRLAAGGFMLMLWSAVLNRIRG
jgi:hypothetical protein